MALPNARKPNAVRMGAAPPRGDKAGVFQDFEAAGGIENLLKATAPALLSPSMRALLFPLGRSLTMKAADVAIGPGLRANLNGAYGRQVGEAATAAGVDPGLLKGIVFEESSHATPAEGLLEPLGIDHSAGPAQVSAGTEGYSRQQLMNPRTNLEAAAKHLARLQRETPIDPSDPAASLATRYNCGSCREITPYGRRVAAYRQRWFASR